MAHDQTDEAVELVIKRVIREREAQAPELEQARARVVALEQRDQERVNLARGLLKELPSERQRGYLRHFPWLSEGPDPASRQAVLIGIMQIFMSNPTDEFTALDIEQRLAMQGIHANQKRIYNTLNYLAADGRLKRNSPGRYMAGPDLLRAKQSQAEAAESA